MEINSFRACRVEEYLSRPNTWRLPSHRNQDHRNAALSVALLVSRVRSAKYRWSHDGLSALIRARMPGNAFRCRILMHEVMHGGPNRVELS